MRTLFCFVLVGLSLGCVDGEAPGAIRDDAAIPDAAVWDAEYTPAPDSGAVRASGLPCAIEQLLAKHCRSCHGAPPDPGVPIPLVSYADLTATGREGRPVFERVGVRIHLTQDPMPPVREMATLDAAALNTLDDWIAAGAPASKDTCVQTTPDKTPEIDLSACEQLPVLLAHDGQQESDQQGFTVPLADTTYECFNFAVPWDKPVQGLSILPAIDDGRVLHHMALYWSSSGVPGTHAPCTHGLDRVMLGGWSPGWDKLEFAGEYGMMMPREQRGVLQLEIHYNNVGRYASRDRSGLKICATSKFRPKTVAMHMLANDEISLPPGRHDVIAKCTVWSDKGPATVLATSPHMHLLGVHLRTTVTHTDGTEETLTDGPFSFDNQAIHFLQKPIIIKKGDVLTTTCSYDNTTGRVIRYSKGTDGEMCTNGVFASPPGSLTGGLPGTLLETLGVPNLCVGLGPDSILGL